MRLTWKDGVATLLAIGVGFVAFAVSLEWGWPLLGSYRAGTLAILVLGMGMCALGGSADAGSKDRGPFTTTMSLIGVLAMVFAVWALIAGEQEPFLAFAITTEMMWLLSTARHALGHAVPAGAH